MADDSDDLIHTRVPHNRERLLSASPVIKAPAMADDTMTPERLAELFHGTYERLAPSFGYQTRPASATAWANVPEPNKSLMIAVAAEVLAAVRAETTQEVEQLRALNAQQYDAWLARCEKAEAQIAAVRAENDRTLRTMGGEVEVLRSEVVRMHNEIERLLATHPR